jgi:hypothetical protein
MYGVPSATFRVLAKLGNDSHQLKMIQSLRMITIYTSLFHLHDCGLHASSLAIRACDASAELAPCRDG